jgi:2-oxoisovalerate dehydrogenase E2 component (dihydrolipoyl transacylase)
VAITVKMPKLGESVTEGTIGTWLVEPGQQVSKYDSLVEVITDKVTAEVPSPASGTVGELLASEGQRLTVGEPICTLDGAEEEAAEAAPSSPPPDEEAPLAVAGPSVSAPAASDTPASSVPAGVTGPATPSDQEAGFISPAVRALAVENGVDLSRVVGTGFQGRVTKRDVLLFLEGGPTTVGAQPPPAELSAARTDTVPAAGPGERIPLSPMRRAIAEHMVRSRQTSPHAWTMVEVDMSGVAQARAANREQFRRATGADLSLLPFAMKATCLALRAVPSLNAVLESDAVVLQRAVNLGVAVSVPDGLIVPVVREADRYSIAGLAQAANELIGRARTGRSRLDDVEGGTFTLNNAGALGTVMSQAIINQPQAAILVMDAVVKRPVVVGDAIAIRPMMNLCLSFDHRINDGSAAALFLGAVKGWLEGASAETPIY